ncbi:formamidopyrimidine-DNA glycosylase H2TH domain protein [Mycobacterium xenopi 4042]|uniref:DNA-(apurinic or apyrimidinic site) lyase n=1 Tax=Mycobacterium xenopi 4042 TaxID=1299334 RepID=X8AQ61_MYCXE|nr:formamidopyrimidine-DNA glycosylase H2TH domain protein [Mycobacterium xenopi 4042]
MPEGHTLHRLARLHQRRFGGAPVAVSSPQGRFAAAASAVDGLVLRRTSVWGKHLFHHYVDGPTVHVHLGLYGHFTEWPVGPDSPSRHRWGRCGCGWWGRIRHRLARPDRVPTARRRPGGRRGVAACPDPLRRDADPAWAWTRIAKSRRPIGALLMDQTVIAGVGNVYRNELPFRHGINPHRPGRTITDAEFDTAWRDLVTLMKIGLRRGQIIVVRPEHDCGAPSYLPDRPRTYVYRRAGEPCRICSTTIVTAELEGRNVFWCPTCQR